MYATGLILRLIAVVWFGIGATWAWNMPGALTIAYVFLIFFAPAVFVYKQGTKFMDKSEDRACPVCAETIKREAKKCRHCGAALPAQA